MFYTPFYLDRGRKMMFHTSGEAGNVDITHLDFKRIKRIVYKNGGYFIKAYGKIIDVENPFYTDISKNNESYFANREEK
jgi:hypothetical protein